MLFASKRTNVLQGFAALQTNNDVQMIEVLQVGREEIPEAIKTLQRALEREREKENVVFGGVGVSLVSSKGTAITATPGATPFTGLTNNKPGVVQQLPTVPEGRRGSMPIMARDCSVGEEEDVCEFGEQGEWDCAEFDW
jgi:hypothetical protein